MFRVSPSPNSLKILLFYKESNKHVFISSQLNLFGEVVVGSGHMCVTRPDSYDRSITAKINDPSDLNF